jgi:hypothetical protein
MYLTVPSGSTMRYSTVTGVKSRMACSKVRCTNARSAGCTRAQNSASSAPVVHGRATVGSAPYIRYSSSDQASAPVTRFQLQLPV